MKEQPHTWMEYQWRFRSANDNNKMWVRDDERIHQVSNGSYIIALGDIWYDDVFSSFEDAVKMFDETKLQ